MTSFRVKPFLVVCPLQHPRVSADSFDFVADWGIRVLNIQATSLQNHIVSTLLQNVTIDDSTHEASSRHDHELAHAPHHRPAPPRHRPAPPPCAVTITHRHRHRRSRSLPHLPRSPSPLTFRLVVACPSLRPALLVAAEHQFIVPAGPSPIAGSFFLEDYTSLMLSFLIASVSAGPTSTTSIGPSPIKNHCVDGVVPHSYMVTLKSPLPPDRRSAPTSAGLNTNKGDLSFLHGWFRQYTTKNTSNGTTRRKLEAGSNSAHAVHYFMQTRLAVAIEAGDDVRHARHAPKSSTWPSASRLYSRSHTAPGRHEHGQGPGCLLG
jgi:hypothetical protein